MTDKLSGIESDISEIKVRLFAHLELEEKQNEEIHELLKKHEKAIYGNGEPGIRTQIDRLEQIEKNRKWHYGVIYSVIVAALVRWVADWVGRR